MTKPFCAQYNIPQRTLTGLTHDIFHTEMHVTYYVTTRRMTEPEFMDALRKNMEALVWAETTFGPPGALPIKRKRWYVYDNLYYFRKESDKMMFDLRWR